MPLPAAPLDLIVTDRTPVADTADLFEFVRPDGGTLPAFEAGAHVRVQVP